MNKQSAADFLGVSVRALERYVQQGRIGVKYEKGKTRPTANFDQTELEAFKEELNQPTVKPAFESRQIATEQQPQTGKLVHQAGEIAEFGEIGVIDKLSSIIEVIGSTANLWLLTLTCIGDGHDGIWNIVREFKPEQERREIQDLFHLMENLYKVGGSIQRINKVKGLLWEGKVDDAIACFVDCTLKQAENFCVYLEKHRHRIVNYQYYQAEQICSIGKACY